MGTLNAFRNALAGDVVAALSAEIAALKVKAAAAFDEIDRLRRQSAEAPTFDEAQAAERKIAEQEWAIRRADALLPELEAQLAEAKAEKQSRAIARHPTATLAL